MYIPSDNLDLRINGEPVYGFQFDRPERKDEMSVLESYNLNYNTLKFVLPITYKPILFDRADLNVIELFYKGDIIFSGCPAGQFDFDYRQGAGVIIIDASPWLGLISKSVSAYDIGASKPAALLSEIIGNLDARYTVISNVHNDVSGIYLAVDTDGEETEDISVLNNICDLLCMGVFLNSFYLEMFMLPEALIEGEELDNKILVDTQPIINSVTSMDYDKIVLTYKNTVGGTEETATAGAGKLVKSVSAENIYVDDTTAQNIVNRQYALFSTPWVSMTQSVAKEFKIGDRVSYGGYNFFVCSVECKYTHWIIKCYGKKGE